MHFDSSYHEIIPESSATLTLPDYGSVARHLSAIGGMLQIDVPISHKATSGQLHVSLAENRLSIQCPPSDNFRIARDTGAITKGNRADHICRSLQRFVYFRCSTRNKSDKLRV